MKVDKQELLYSEDIEKSIISCLATLKECCKYIKRIEIDDFAIGIHQVIFSIIKMLYSNEGTIDIITIKEKAKEMGQDENRIFKYLVEISELFYVSSNIESYIQKLKTYKTKREILKKAREIQDYIYASGTEIESAELKKESIKKLTDISINKTNTEHEEMKNVIMESMKSIEDRYIKRDDNTYKTGFWDLDKITDGLHEQEFTIIAARPGCGKTAFALNMAENISEKGVQTYFVSLEMSDKQLGNRLISSRSGIDSHKLRCGWLEDEDFKKIMEVNSELSDLKMIIDTTSKTIQDIELRAIELKETKNIGLIIVDYLQLLKSKEKFNIREQEVADISRKLKLLSRDLNIPVIGLCQLNRETEKRKKPVLADLRESGSLEQDADNVIFLYIAEEEKIKQFSINVETIVAKQRNGPTGSVFLGFNRKTMKFFCKAGGV